MIKQIDASSVSAGGLAPGCTTQDNIDAIQMPACRMIEVYNRSNDPIWFAINPPGDTFTAGGLASQVVDPGEYIEWPVDGAPKVCIRGYGTNVYQVRKIA